jgi:hypothetical protein
MHYHFPTTHFPTTHEPAAPRFSEAQIREKVRMVVRDEASFGVLSTGEKIAVAFVLDRPDLVKQAWGTMLEAVHRLGPEWTAAAWRVQRDGWQEGP